MSIITRSPGVVWSVVMVMFAVTGGADESIYTTPHSLAFLRLLAISSSLKAVSTSSQIRRIRLSTLMRISLTISCAFSYAVFCLHNAILTGARRSRRARPGQQSPHLPFFFGGQILEAHADRLAARPECRIAQAHDLCRVAADA